MTPAEYQEQVLPEILSALGDRCICKLPGLRKLLSFNFEDYGAGPMACADTEILIQSLLRDGNANYTATPDAEGNYTFLCSTCGTALVEHFEDYSINMYRSYIEYDQRRSVHGRYLVGFRSFTIADRDRIDDFTEAESKEAYLEYLAKR